MRLYQVAGGSTTRFAYDGLAMIAEYNVSNVLQRRFVHGPGVDEPLVQYEGSGTTDRRWYHADERGSIAASSDSSGNLIAINRYDEYGKPQATNAGRFQYTGQIWLAELDAYYFKARVYAPHLGRFLQTDPAGMTASPNLYAYVVNDPIGLVDPFGLVQCTGSHLERDNCGNSPDPVSCMGDCSGWATVIKTTVTVISKVEDQGTVEDQETFQEQLNTCLANLNRCLTNAAQGTSIGNIPTDAEGYRFVGRGQPGGGTVYNLLTGESRLRFQIWAPQLRQIQPGPSGGPLANPYPILNVAGSFSVRFADSFGNHMIRDVVFGTGYSRRYLVVPSGTEFFTIHGTEMTPRLVYFWIYGR